MSNGCVVHNVLVVGANIRVPLTFLSQYAEEEKRRRERERVENFQALMQAEEEPLVTNDEQFDCPICMTEVEPGEGVRLRGCLHQFCK